MRFDLRCDSCCVTQGREGDQHVLDLGRAVEPGLVDRHDRAFTLTKLARQAQGILGTPIWRVSLSTAQTTSTENLPAQAASRATFSLA